jgi:hypothetical protein
VSEGARRSFVALAALLLALVTASCGAPPATPLPPAPAPAAHADVALAGHLPADALAFFAADSPSRLFEGLARDAILGAFRAEGERLVFEIVREIGHDLTSLDTLAELGVDVYGPVAFGLLEQRRGDPTAVLLLTLARPERFKAEVYRIAARRGGGPQVIGEAVVVDTDKVAWLLDGALAIVVAGREATATAARLAQLRPGISLAAEERFTAAVGALSQRATVTGFVDARAIALAAFDVDGRWGGRTRAESAARLERKSSAMLAAARTAGADVGTIVALSDDFEDARRRMQEEPEAPLGRALFGSLDGVAIGVELSPAAIHLEVVAMLDEGSLLGRVLGAPAAAGALAADDTTAHLSATFDPAVLGEIAELAGGDGAELARALGGTADLVVGGGADAAPGFRGRLALRDEAAGKALVDRLLAIAGESVRDKLTVAVAKGFATVTLGAPPADTTVRSAGIALHALPGRLVGAIMLLEAPIGEPVWEPWRDPAVPRSPEYEAKAAELRDHAAKIAAAEARSRHGQIARLAPALDRLGTLDAALSPAPVGLRLTAHWQVGGTTIAAVLAEVSKRLRERDRVPADTELHDLYDRQYELGRELIEIYRRDEQRHRQGN